VKVCRLLIDEDARRSPTVFGGAKSLESFLRDRRVFPMVVGVQLYIRRADVHLAAAVLSAIKQHKIYIFVYFQ